MKLFSKQPGFRRDFNLLLVFGMEKILLDILFDDNCSRTYIRFETNLYICFPLIHTVKIMQEPDLNLHIKGLTWTVQVPHLHAPSS